MLALLPTHRGMKDSHHGESRHNVDGEKRGRTRRKSPLADLLVENGLLANLEEARRWIMAGKVLVNGRLLDKPGMLVASDAILQVRSRSRYASRAGYKLEVALEHFAINVAGCAALDCGASTGGFTDCLLQHGASLVYAVDTGYGQLIGRLRADPRVHNLERTNLGDLAPVMLNPLPTLVTLDLSYLSLTKAFPLAVPLLAPQGRVLALVKPLFEVESAEARRTGRIDEPVLIAQALQRVLEAGNSCGLTVQGVVKLALQPRHGTHEFFASFVQGMDALSCHYTEQTLLTIVEGKGTGCSEEE